MMDTENFRMPISDGLARNNVLDFVETIKFLEKSAFYKTTQSTLDLP